MGPATPPLARLAGRLELINRRIGECVRWFALLMVLLQFIVVLLRYVFGISSIALNESVLYLHATLFMLGAGYTLLLDEHVRVDIFQARASVRVQAWIDLLGHLLFLLPAMGTLLYWSWPSVRNAWAILEGPISVGGIPAAFLLKSLIPAFCVLLCVQSAACVLRQICRLQSITAAQTTDTRTTDAQTTDSQTTAAQTTDAQTTDAQTTDARTTKAGRQDRHS